MVILKRAGLVVLGLLVIAGLVTILIWVPKIEVYGLDQVRHPQKISRAFYRRDVFTQEDRARQTLATIVGGLLVLVGAYMTWRNVRATERNAEIARDNAETARKVAEQNAETAQRNIKIAEDKQLTDRFTAGVTNLSAEGPEKMAQRLGGIYALERIARDSPEDHWTVMEVLTAYVRDKRPIIMKDEEDKAKELTEKMELIKKGLPTDIAAILTVIRKRNVEYDKGGTFDLRGANLAFARLFKVSMVGADLWDTNLTSAYLRKADLSHANLWNANLFRAHLLEANLSGTDLSEAKLWEADLAGCLNLTQRQLDSANQEKPPNSLPPGLTFPGYVARDPSITPPAAPRPPTTPAKSETPAAPAHSRAPHTPPAP